MVPGPMTIFFHLSDRLYLPGDIKLAGLYGENLLANGHSSTNDPWEEFFREQVRIAHFSSKPSRFKSSFVFETLEDARWAKMTFPQWNNAFIYEASFQCPSSPIYRVCMTAYQPNHPMGKIKQAQEFWATPPQYDAHNEIFAESNLVIGAQIP
jgi:spore germination protein YaaH